MKDSQNGESPQSGDLGKNKIMGTGEDSKSNNRGPRRYAYEGGFKSMTQT